MTAPTDTTTAPVAERKPPVQPLRVAFLCGGSYVSGMELIELSIMKGLADRGHAIHCIASAWNNGDFISRLERAKIPWSTAFTGKITLSPRLRHFGWTLDALRKVRGARRMVGSTLAGFRPDIVVACNRDAVLLLGKSLSRYPIVFHSHEAPDLNWRSRMAMALLDNRIHHYVGVSDAVRERLMALGIDRARVSVIRNGIPPTDHAQPARGGRPFTIGICGQIGPWKGHADVVEALAILRREGVTVRCLVFGNGNAGFVESLRQRVAQYGISDYLEWRGFVQDQDAIYRELDVLVVPSRHSDPLPTVALEAGIRGIPVVATRKGGLPEIIVDGVTGLLVDSDNPLQIARAVKMLAHNPDQVKQMGMSARNRIITHFAPERMIKEHEAQLHEVVVGY